MRAQVALQRLELLAVFQANNVVRHDGLLHRNLGLELLAILRHGNTRCACQRGMCLVDELRNLLAEIQTALGEIVAHKEALQQISSATPFTAMGAEASIKEAAAKIESDLDQGQAKSVQQSLTEATTLLSGILDGAKTVAEKSAEVGRTVKPIADHLAPLIEKLGIAALWVGKLWLSG